ncbi:hypothetical protein DC083_03485 [Ignatzschineria ureiclastica]|uniref:Capsular biosynthesis protein n=1 Tax=Ignatzschineria ureiclastica TaxID=472582 RepID=A0A2U2AG14_9GAMM|nr:hypothetical protein [Ignatzschineria ureiclastica]PWD81519.1 hypothetical protein DC083_03485 [Ignatzschineria ureiclastica]GHA01301.1 hypothetical protein GCM10007162_17050 [Ignatzschineria ureiclastica]
MIIITSSAYLSAEFQVELGAIPPTFLPLGNKKLLEHQVMTLRQFYDDQITLTLPESFEITEILQKQIDRLEIEVIQVPDQFSLSEAILYTLNVSTTEDEKPVRILYGDTYIADFSFAEVSDDLIAIAKVKNSYNWEYVDTILHQDNLVWCGYFSFSHKSLLLKSLALVRDHFNEAVKYYAKQCNVAYGMTEHWQDLGHINTYFAARANLTTQRAFNTLQIENGVVTKSGEPTRKIAAEAHWFEAIPKHLRIFTPLYLGESTLNGKLGYSLEYLSSMPLNELFVHGQNQVQDWQVIFDEVKRWFALSSSENVAIPAEITAEYQRLIAEKTDERIAQFAKESGISLDLPTYYAGKKLPSIREICREAIEATLKLPSRLGILHGDLCFSNMLFDSRGLRLKLIDPRGLDSAGNFTLYGDLKYDYAKLTHSVIGLYDFIISGDFLIENAGTSEVLLHFDIDDRIAEIQALFAKISFLKGVTLQDILPGVILLFFSMLPLHNDRPDRQDAMLLNAFRLYYLYLK